MAGEWTFIWGAAGHTTSTDVNHAKNWEKNSLRNAQISWVASTVDATEFIAHTSTGGDAKIAQPDFVYIAGTVATSGSVDSLATGEWGYGDPGSANGYNSVVARLTGDTDPDTEDLDHIEFQDVPYANMNIDLGATAKNMDTNLTAFEDITFLDILIPMDYTGLIGTEATAWGVLLSGTLHIGTHRDLTVLAGSQRIHMHLGQSNCTVKIDRSGAQAIDTGVLPIRLHVDHASTNIYIRGGRSSWAVRPGEVFQAALLSVSDVINTPVVRVGSAMRQSDITYATLETFGSVNVLVYDGPTANLNMFNGSVAALRGAGTFGTATLRERSRFIFASQGSATASVVNLHDSTLDLWEMEQATTILQVDLESEGARIRENDDTTITTLNRNYNGKRELIVG